MLQRKAVGSVVYALELLLNPLVFASAAVAADPGLSALAVWTLFSSVKAFLDSSSIRILRGSPVPLRYWPGLALKDLLVSLAWLYGLISNRVNWRGNRLVVLEGTRLEPAGDPSAQIEGAPAPLTGPS